MILIKLLCTERRTMAISEWSRSVQSAFLEIHLNGQYQVLLHWDADIDAVESGGNTPLHIAAHYGHTSIVKVNTRKDSRT